MHNLFSKQEKLLIRIQITHYLYTDITLYVFVIHNIFLYK